MYLTTTYITTNQFHTYQPPTNLPTTYLHVYQPLTYLPATYIPTNLLHTYQPTTYFSITYMSTNQLHVFLSPHLHYEPPTCLPTNQPMIMKLNSFLPAEEWVAAPSMSEKRLWSAATTYPVKTGSGNGFFVTGGKHLDVNALDSTEIFIPSDVEGELG